MTNATKSGRGSLLGIKRFCRCVVSRMLTIGLIGVAFAGSAALNLGAADRVPVKVIFDTDMYTDYDDAAALACLHALADAGECEILATVASTRESMSVAMCEIVNAYYGRPDIPVGCVKGIGLGNDPSGTHRRCYGATVEKYSKWVKYRNSDDAPDAADVYRKVLSAQPDKSVVLCSVGFLSNMRRLVETDRDLVARKVKLWVVMACTYPKGKSYNSKMDAESSRIALEGWPTPIAFSDYQYGMDCYAGRALAESDVTDNPVADVFRGNMPSREEIAKDPGRHLRGCNGLLGRAAWDEVAVLAAVRGVDSYFNVRRGTFRMIGEDGENEWVPDETNGPHVRLTEKISKLEVGRIIDELICRKPLKKQAPGADIRKGGGSQPLNGGWTADGVPVALPHCWNVEDGTDGPNDPRCWNHDSVGGTGYARRKVVYRRELPRSDKTRWLRVNAASIHAVVRLDGREVGRHAGAFTAFAVEIPASCAAGCRVGGKHVVEIEVDNFYDPDVPPVCGDFTMYGGLYRGVDLLDAPETFAPPTELPKYEFREDGFYVDDKKTFLKGVCYHQDREGKGWAISAADEEEDVRLIKAMGANAIRTSHYPRSERFYELCDKYGLYVWTEIPLVDATTASAAFRSNTLNVAREMVLQHRHHKCIAMWGIFNELYLKKMPDGQAEPLVREVKELIRSLDPRPVVAASNNPKKTELNAIPDALGFNMYPGWYGGKSTDLGREIEEWRTANGRSCVAVSEYGAGGSPGQPMPSPDYRPEPGGKCHPVDYQLKHHVESWKAIKSNPHVWGSFLWVMFDAGSDSRHEGARDGINDKGLVGFDHKSPKPAYLFYRKEWMTYSDAGL